MAASQKPDSATRASSVVWVACLLVGHQGCASEGEPAGKTPAASTTTPGPTQSTAVAVPASAAFDLAKAGTTYTATSRKTPTIKIEVDCDDHKVDGHYFGITPIIDGRRLDGPIWDTTIGFFTPDDDAGIGTSQCLSVEVVGDRFQVRFATGSYRTLVASGPDKPVPMNADLYVDANQHLVAEVSGLYYMLPTTQDTAVRITTNGAVQLREFRAPTTDTLEYFDNVTLLDVDDSKFGHFTVETNIVWLQLQHEAKYSRFELDLDHSYKDRGQESVSSKVTFF